MKLSYFLLLLFFMSCATARWLIEEQTQQTQEVVLARKNPPQEIEVREELKAGDYLDLNLAEELLHIKEQTTLAEESTLEALKKADASRQRAKKSGSKPLPVTYSGDEFIREVLPQKNPKEGTIVTIKGKATIKRGAMTLSSQVIKIFGEDAAYARASGNLQLEDKSQNLQLTAQIAEFYKLENKVVVRGNPIMQQQNLRTKEKTILRCYEIERLLEQQITICHGKLSLTNKESTLFAGQAIYDEKKQIIEFIQKPRVFHRDNILLAQKIIYYLNSGRIEAMDEVRFFLTENNPKKSSETLVTTIVDADYALTERGEQVYLSQKITLTGNRVKVSRSEVAAWAEKIEIWGSSGEEILATGNVELFSLRDNLKITGENLRFFKIGGLAVMKSSQKNGVKIKPQATFYDKEGKVSGLVSAETLERSALLNQSQARGNLEMVFPQDSGNILVRGEWADIDEKRQIVIVKGNPYLDDPAGKIYAREIILFAAEKRFELVGPLQGAFQKSLTQ